MVRDGYRLLTTLLVALSAGMAFCHLLEMPVRLGYPAELWIRVTVTEATYRYFGAPVGAAIESGAWLTAVGLAFLSRGQGWTFRLTAAGAVLAVAAHAVWWLWVQPVNSEMAGWSPDAIPPLFDAARAQWEAAHAARAALFVAALGALIAAAIGAAPHRPPAHPEGGGMSPAPRSRPEKVTTR